MTGRRRRVRKRFKIIDDFISGGYESIKKLEMYFSRTERTGHGGVSSNNRRAHNNYNFIYTVIYC